METSFFSPEELAQLPHWAQDRIRQMQTKIDGHKSLIQMKMEWETARRKFIERNPIRVYKRKAAE